MKALSYRRHGGNEVVEYGDLPAPEPSAGEVLVRLEAAALNRVDLFTREGWPGLDLEFPHVPGSDGAGEVVALGEGATQFKVGDKLVINANLSCGVCEYCIVGQDNRCRRWRLLGEHVPGAFRELIALPERSLFKLPSDFDTEIAAAAALVYLTAWHSLITRGRLRAGESVLVVGASGGVNVASIQIAKLAGCSVLVVGSDAAKLAVAESAGADTLFDRSENEAWSKAAYLADGRRGVDVVVDNVGAKTLPLSLRAARKGGRILTVGSTSGSEVALDNRFMFGKHLSLIGSTMGTLDEFATVMQLIIEGKLSPILDQQFPLSEGADALARMESGEQLGKITLKIP